MFSSILVPLDGSALSERALAYTTLLADPDASLTLLAVVEPARDLTGYELANHVEETQRIRAHLSQVLSTASEQLHGSGHAVHTTVRTGDAGAEILACATEMAPDLIVLTTHGRTGFLRWVEGSVAQTVLRHAQLPVLIVQPDMDRVPTPLAIDKIVVPLDGSELAARALPVARALARRHDVPLEVVRVLDNWSEATGFPPSACVTPSAAEENTIGSQVLGTATTLIDAPVTERELRGEPITALAEYLALEPNALVIMTAHGRSESARYPTDSVAEGLVTHTHVPLLIMRASAPHTKR